MMFFITFATLVCGSPWPAASLAATEQRAAPQAAGSRHATGKHPVGAVSGQSRSGPGALKADAGKKGTPVRHLHERAVKDAGLKKKAMNTTPGIDSALDEAAGKKKKKKSGLGVSVENETATWRERLPTESARPDESLPLESRHVVRAFADVDAGEDLSISVGPELILKDEQNRDHSANNSQPDSALGLGMQFKLDF